MDHVFIRGKPIEFQHFIHICIRKAKVFIIPYIRDRVYLQIVQPCENTFFGDPETPGKRCKVQAVIRLQGIAKQAADEIYHLIVVSGLECLIQRNVILIDHQDDLLAIVLG